MKAYFFKIAEYLSIFYNLTSDKFIVDALLMIFASINNFDRKKINWDLFFHIVGKRRIADRASATSSNYRSCSDSYQ